MARREWKIKGFSLSPKTVARVKALTRKRFGPRLTRMESAFVNELIWAVDVDGGKITLGGPGAEPMEEDE